VSYLDLINFPFTLPGSRLIILKESAISLALSTAEYEMSPAEALVCRSLKISAGGSFLEWSVQSLDSLKFGDSVRIVFSSLRSITIINNGDLPIELHIDHGFKSDENSFWRPNLPHAAWAKLSAISHIVAARNTVSLLVGSDLDLEDFPMAEDFGERIWSEWMAKAPVVDSDDQEMSNFCWAVLGSNTLEIIPGRNSIVPSKLGYVAHWQWDAYFIALGVMHGDMGLAREQIGIALSAQSANGQLQDVIHDFGTLRNFSDLPRNEYEFFVQKRAQALPNPQDIPLTKPPLTAWAVAKLYERDVDDSIKWYRTIFAQISLAQEWWFKYSDFNLDGIPEYQHPYSSGLDDSPIFDGLRDWTTPDLTSYLILEDEVLEQFQRKINFSGKYDFVKRSRELSQKLTNSWNEEAEMFPSFLDNEKNFTRSIMNLMPLLVTGVPSALKEILVEQISDPKLFGGNFRIPTVARDEFEFSASQMWRGPIWLNTNYLVIDGLRKSGFVDLSAEISARTLEMVKEAGGPVEYYDAVTGLKPSRAVGAFSWSAALFIQMAVEKHEGTSGSIR